MAAQTVSKGLSTWAGLIAAAGQYAGAVAVFLNDPDKATALGPLTTATVTLVVVIAGRMQQATEAVKVSAPVAAPVKMTLDGREIAQATAQISPRPSVDVGIGMPPPPSKPPRSTPPLDPVRRAPDVDGQLDDEDEPGDPDALPDYETTTVVPPDEGDRPPEPTS